MQYMIKGMQPPVPYMPMPRYIMDMDISSTAKILYTVLLSRALISSQTDGWQDEQGRVYIYYTIDDLRTVLHRGESAILDALAALEMHGLITRVRQGPGQANRIYVMVPPTENRSAQPRKTAVHAPGKPRRNNDIDNKDIDQTGGYDTL